MDSDDGMTHPGSAHALGSPDVPRAQRGELRRRGDVHLRQRFLSRHHPDSELLPRKSEPTAERVSELPRSGEERGDQPHNG